MLALGVALLHLLALLLITRTLDWQLQPPTATAPLHTRMITPAPVTAPTPPVTRPVTRPRAPLPAPALRPDPAPTETPASDTPPPAPAPTETVSTTAASEPAAPPSAGIATAPVAEASAAQPESVPAATWPTMALGVLPASSLLSYQLTGMDKGFTYHANGELRWQHNPQAYALTLSVRAFLIGSRQWRSSGRIDSAGLSPLKFTDSWRGERAAHFDREQNRIVFSSNAPVATLLPGAQDQISLYMQLAAAMAGEPERYPAGSRLQVQTATLRDAVPWLLVLEGREALTVSGQTIQASKWVCQPRNRYEARVEIWLSPQHGWMPARIRITQVSGSYIDLNLRSMEPLPPLPGETSVGEKTTGS